MAHFYISVYTPIPWTTRSGACGTNWSLTQSIPPISRPFFGWDIKLKNSISKTPDAVPVWPCVRRFPMGIFYAFQSLLRQGVEQSYCHPTDHRRKALISMDFLPPKCVDSVSIDRTSFNNEVIFCFTIRSLKDLTSLFIILRRTTHESQDFMVRYLWRCSYAAYFDC